MINKETETANPRIMIEGSPMTASSSSCKQPLFILATSLMSSPTINPQSCFALRQHGVGNMPEHLGKIYKVKSVMSF